jgi:hypothetical protein
MQAQVSPAVGHETAAAVDDEHLLLRDDGDDGRRRYAADSSAARSHLEQRRVVRIAVREHALDRAATAARK